MNVMVNKSKINSDVFRRLTTINKGLINQAFSSSAQFNYLSFKVE